MTSEIKKLARHRLSRAREALSEGDLLLGREASIGAINRFYYAAFYAARALLATQQLDSPRHSGLITLFQKHFVKTNLLEADRARALSRAFEKRQKSDYGDFATVTLEEARNIRREVSAFVEACAHLLERLLSEA